MKVEEYNDTQKQIQSTARQIKYHVSEARKNLDAAHTLMNGDPAADRVESRHDAKTLADLVHQYYFDVHEGYGSYCHDMW